MTIPNLDPIGGRIRDISPATLYSPYAPNWWMQSTISDIPESAVGWLVAQGWQVVGSTEEDGAHYYTLSRESMQSWKILQTVLDSYTNAYNEGRSANSIRYNDIIYNYNRTIEKSRGTLNEIGDVSDGHITLFINQMDSLVSELETDLDAINVKIDSAVDSVDDQLAKYLVTLNTIAGDFTLHQTTTRALLTDLGATELARINEQYDNLLSSTRQGLVNRGLYSSTIYAQYQTRVERERSEAITKLNDMLNREKLQNEHQLYSQLVAQKQALMVGRLQHNQSEMGKCTFLADAKHRILMSIMQARLGKANARLDVRDREEKLMAYQLDTRNNLAVGLYGFMERREDVYPGLESITKLVAGLGDAGGAWVTP